MIATGLLLAFDPWNNMARLVRANSIMLKYHTCLGHWGVRYGTGRSHWHRALHSCVAINVLLLHPYRLVQWYRVHHWRKPQMPHLTPENYCKVGLTMVFKMPPLKQESPRVRSMTKYFIRPLLDTTTVTAIQYQRQGPASSWPRESCLIMTLLCGFPLPHNPISVEPKAKPQWRQPEA